MRTSLVPNICSHLKIHKMYLYQKQSTVFTSSIVQYILYSYWVTLYKFKNSYSFRLQDYGLFQRHIQYCAVKLVSVMTVVRHKYGDAGFQYCGGCVSGRRTCWCRLYSQSFQRVVSASTFVLVTNTAVRMIPCWIVDREKIESIVTEQIVSGKKMDNFVVRTKYRQHSGLRLKPHESCEQRHKKSCWRQCKSKAWSGMVERANSVVGKQQKSERKIELFTIKRTKGSQSFIHSALKQEKKWNERMRKNNVVCIGLMNHYTDSAVSCIWTTRALYHLLSMEKNLIWLYEKYVNLISVLFLIIPLNRVHHIQQV